MENRTQAFLLTSRYSISRSCYKVDSAANKAKNELYSLFSRSIRWGREFAK